MVEPLALVLHSRSADLGLHAGAGTGGNTGRTARPHWTAPPLVLAGLVVVDHEDDLFAREGHRPRPHRHFETQCLRGESALGSRYSCRVCKPAFSVPDRLQERTAFVSGGRLAVEAIWADLHRSAESFALDRQ